MIVYRTMRLSLTDDHSDKQHILTIYQVDDTTYELHCQHGANGKKLSAPTIKGPFDRAGADKALAAFVNSKTRKGYEVDPTFGVRVDATQPPSSLLDVKERTKTDIPVQLLRAIDTDELESLLRNHYWCLQLKANGERLLAQVGENGTVLFVNRQGIATVGPAGVAAALATLPPGTIVDGECVGDTMYVFDLVAQGHTSVRDQSYQRRFTALQAILPESSVVKLIPHAIDEHEKRALLARVRKIRGEGVVAKDLRAPHTAGKSTSGGPAVKYKFIKDATFRCSDVPGPDQPRSIGLSLLDPATGTWVDCGRCSIPPSSPLPAVGDLVDVAFLYAERSQKLHQPVFVRIRTDLDTNDALLTQLANAYVNRTAEEALAS